MESQVRLRRQYEFERECNRRLLGADRKARCGLYSQVYRELFTSEFAPETQGSGEEETEATELIRKLLLPYMFPECVFLEIGGGDGAVSFSVAQQVGEVLLIEAFNRLEGRRPSNLRLIRSDMPPFDIPAESVDLAFSCHLVEHLHPEDALEHSKEVLRVLVPGGRYICITPNRVYGPHDVSKYFGHQQACGLHLCEYSCGELASLLARAGFSAIRALHGIGGPAIERRLNWQIGFEWVLLHSPAAIRSCVLQVLGAISSEPFRPMEQVVLIATRSEL